MEMLRDLYLLSTYFEESFGVVHEEELVRRYGRQETSDAIDNGYVDHARIPCGSGKTRCVCRLSDKGLQKAQGTGLHI